MTSERALIDPGKLTVFASAILQKAGVPEHDADIMAKILVATDLRGIDSHGVPHLAMYARQILAGRVNPDPKTMVYSRAAATAIMEGDRGPGFVVGHRAMTEAMTMTIKLTSCQFIRTYPRFRLPAKNLEKCLYLGPYA